MAIYGMGDLHLSLGADKPMDIFGGWDHYMQRISENCKAVLHPEDTFVIPGDLSWGMNLEESLPDFQFIDALPGRKIILKGNHDYFWSTRTKMEHFFFENGIKTIEILHNNALEAEGFAICGTRGWVNDGSEATDQKVILREAGRLRTSILAGKAMNKPILCFLHYPPAFHQSICQEIFDVLLDERISSCYYGHIHGQAQRLAIEGNFKGVQLTMISADHLEFCPKRIAGV